MILNNARGFEYGVRHFYSPRSGYLVDILSTALDIETDTAQFLVTFGCIYVEKQRCIENTTIENGTYIRAHTKPRRFLPEKRSGAFELVYENQNYLIVNKPHGLPCHPTVDNLHENLLTELINHFPNQEIHLTHRLDVATSGLIVYAKSIKAQRAFNYALTKHEVTKKYVAQLSGKPSHWGRWEHWMEPSPKAPKNVQALVPQGQQDWQQCLLDITPLNDDKHPLVEVNLLTGRTHQIRAQTKAMLTPIVGDKAYGALEIYDYDRIHLTSYKLQFIDPINNEELKIEISYAFK